MNGSATNKYSELFKTSYIAKPLDAFFTHCLGTFLEDPCANVIQLIMQRNVQQVVVQM
jgi:hypothetical protein